MHGGNCGTLKRRLIAENINFSHIKLGNNSNLGRKFEHFKMTKKEAFENLFIKNCQFKRSSIKRYLKFYDLIPRRCNCGLIDEWNNKQLVLQLEHINGISNDNRLENLKWICPNCHSQTKTFAGRNKRINKEKNVYVKRKTSL